MIEQHVNFYFQSLFSAIIYVFGRRHVEFPQRFVIWWWNIQVSSFHMIYILIMQLRGASFILWMKSKVLLRSEVGMIMVSICLHGVISWSQASSRGRFGPTKTVIAEKYHPSVLKFCLTWTAYNISNKITKFYDDVYSFEPVRGCQFLNLYILMFEKWLESPQWLLAVSKPKVCMCVTWGKFNGAIKQAYSNNKIKTNYYQEAEKEIKSIMKNTVGIRRIRTDKTRRTNNHMIKEKWNIMKHNKTEFQKTCNAGTPKQKVRAKEAYMKSQRELRSEIEKAETKKMKKDWIACMKSQGKPQHHMGSQEKVQRM